MEWDIPKTPPAARGRTDPIASGPRYVTRRPMEPRGRAWPSRRRPIPRETNEEASGVDLQAAPSVCQVGGTEALARSSACGGGAKMSQSYAVRLFEGPVQAVDDDPAAVGDGTGEDR